ncbi:MAG: glycogen synthase GlgA [Elusimicrobia bacterium]|nr:glycogen synthase GlgA [Elusimicrobiota bacterium]
MKILLASSEAVPFCKTGGLADVVGALTQLLSRHGHQVCLFLPKYKSIDLGAFSIKPLPGGYVIPIGDDLEKASLSWAEWKGATVYFVDSPKYFSRNGLYGEEGKDYEDNDERFLFFSRAVLEGAKFVDFRPDVVHCHDWQTALIPAYLKLLYHIDAFYARTGTLLTLHNLAYQGVFPKDVPFIAGFGWTHFTPDRLEYYGGMNFLKAGLVYADRLNTVSPTYAQEIQADGAFGRGLEGVLRQRSADLRGILNGIDLELWDPEKDKLLPKAFGSKTFAEGKAANKAAVRKECGLAESGRGPLFGVISRLDPQKGLDLVVELVPRLVESGAQLVVLGDGSPELREDFRRLASRFPLAVHLHSGFDEPFAHRLYAAVDLFLMPSRFEPCGLGQMIAMRYGALPVATRTGGLADTVREEATPAGLPPNGFVAPAASSAAVWSAIERALSLWARPPEWADRVRAAMGSDYSWDRSAATYEALCREIMALRGQKA